MKKQLSISLLLTVLLSMTGIKAYAHDFEAVNADGKTIYYIYNNGSSGTTVSVSYRGNSYYSYYDEYSGDIVIPESVAYNEKTYSVTRIGGSAFYGCSGLTSVNIPNSVTSIGSSAFFGCSGLTSVTIPNSVTSIDGSAFYGCSGLTSVNIPNSVTSIGSSAFTGTGWYNNQPNGILYLDNCLIGYKGTKPTGEVIIQEGTGVIAISAFSGCSGLTSLTIPNSVTSIGSNAFSGCSSLHSVVIGNGVTEIPAYAFGTGSSLKSLTIGTGVLSINSYAFSSSNTSYKPIKTIWLTNTPPSGYSNASGSVNYVSNNQFSSLSNVIVYQYLSSYFEVDGVIYVPIKPSERTCDAIDCVYNETNTEMNIASQVIYKGVTMNVKKVQPYLASGNKFIKNLVLDYEGEVPAHAFDGCSDLQTLTIGDKVSSIGNYSFNTCSSLQTIVIPDAVTKIGSYAFQGCAALTGITIPNTVTTIGNYVFNDCSRLKNVTIEDRDAELSLGSNGSSPLFSACPLDEVYIGGDIKYNTSSSYGYSPFYRNTSLRSITITDKETEISLNEFFGCTNLQDVSIGDGVTTIANRAFSGCSSLKTFGFGSQLQTIGQEAFSDCTALMEITSKATTPPTCGSQALDDINKWECKLYVPDGTLAAYQAADQWMEFFFAEEGEGTGGGGSGTHDVEQCAKPTITVNDGKLSFDCETEGVTFKSNYTYKNGNTEADGKDLVLAGTTTAHVSVYATKEGYLNSPVATADVELCVGKSGDVNQDGEVSITDAVSVVNIILNGEAAAPAMDTPQEEEPEATPE